MLNPDGVVLGNTRNSLGGLDLNRQWKAPNIVDSPEIFYVKDHVETTLRNRQIFFYSDFHGHSKEFNSFLFACHNNNEPEHVLKERIFPLIMHKTSEDFNYDSC